MASSVDNNGNQPFTQVSRDTMAQADHDKLVEYGVLLKTIVEGQTRLEQQIKDLITGQAQALASWEAKSEAVHQAQEKRVRDLEDIAKINLPRITEFETRLISVEKRIEILEEDKTKFLGGWKTLGIIAGILAFIISIINIFVHIHG